MALFTKTNQVKPVNASLYAASEYLLQRLGREYEASTLSQNLSDLEEGEDPWVVLTLVDPKLRIVETGAFGTWPTRNNAIIRFRINDENNPGTEIDHYCIVADAGDHQVIDSATGVIKNGNVFGQPYDWAVYDMEAVEETVEPDTFDPTRNYVVLSGGESAYQIAIKLGINSADLIDHNELEDPANVPEGTILHLPVALPAKEVPAQTVIELLDRPKKMHVSKEGGTRKLAFGNAKTLGDISATGPTYAENTNVMILAVAHVPLTEEGQQVSAAYYMEALALGDYVHTGRVAWEIGFNHSHLEDGHVDKIKPPVAVRPEIQEQLAKMELEQKITADALVEGEQQHKPEPTLEEKIAVMEADQLAHPERYPSLFKTTYKAFEDGPVVYVADQDMVVHDLEGKRPTRMLPRLKGVKITGTFEKTDEEGNIILYGRPLRGENSWHWYGIPMDLLTPEEELFNTPPTTAAPLAARVANNGPFTLVERYVSIPLSKHLNHPMLKKYVERLKIKI